jgi:Pectate lyase superfamily protein
MKLRVIATVLFVAPLFVTSLVAAQTGNMPVCNVKQYGAVADGKTLDTRAINKAIEACAASGGGIVFFPAGGYVSGTVILKSNITLDLDSGATLIGSKNFEDYKLIGAAEWTPLAYPVRAFILGDGLTNVAIEGHGTIDGNKVYDAQLFREKTKVLRPEQMPGWVVSEVNRGPHTVALTNCTRVRIRDVRVKDSANYAFRIRSCQDVNIRGVSVQDGWDGFNVSGSKLVTISDCNVQSGDDSIAGGGNDHLLISNCLLNSSANAVRLISGNKHVQISNCAIYGPGAYVHRSSEHHATLTGILIEPLHPLLPRWPSDSIEDILVSDVIIQNVRRPFLISTRGSGIAMRDIALNNISVIGGGKEASVIRGDTKIPIANISLYNVRMVTVGGVTEPNFPSPAYGFECSNIENLEFHDVTVRYEDPDRRPALSCDTVENLVLDGLEAENPSEGNPPLELARIKRLRGTVLVPAYKALDFVPESGNSAPIAGQAFKATVQVQGSNQDGLYRVDLRLGTKSYSQWAWLRAGESKEIAFANVVSMEPGEQRLEAGQLIRTVTVQPRPQGSTFVLRDIHVPNLALPPLNVSVVVSNIGAERGTDTVPLYVDSTLKNSTQVDLLPDESKRIDLKISTLPPGEHEIRVGNLPGRSIQIPGAVRPPYQVVGDSHSCYQFGSQNRFYVVEQRSRYEIADEYHAVFVEKGLGPEGSVVVKIANPTGRGGWSGRVGLIVRDAMAGPKSAGYLVLAASPSNGWSLQWDENGDGILDQHTEFEGYTVWPSWLKLVRHGNTFTGFYSTDHLQWKLVGSARVPSAQPRLDVGMFAAGMTGEFSEFSIQPGGRGSPQDPLSKSQEPSTSEASRSAIISRPSKE